MTWPEKRRVTYRGAATRMRASASLRAASRRVLDSACRNRASFACHGPKACEGGRREDPFARGPGRAPHARSSNGDPQTHYNTIKDNNSGGRGRVSRRAALPRKRQLTLTAQRRFRRAPRGRRVPVNASRLTISSRLRSRQRAGRRRCAERPSLRLSPRAAPRGQPRTGAWSSAAYLRNRTNQ